MSLINLRLKIFLKRHLSRLVVVFFVALLAILPTVSGLSASISGTEQRLTKAPLLINNIEDVIPDRYIVVLKNGISDANIRSLMDQIISFYGAEIHGSYFKALQGFAATLTPTAMEVLRTLPEVAFIEAERSLQLTRDQQNESWVPAPIGQSDPPWGLDRIDQRDRPLDLFFSYASTGEGVNVYVIDTGIRITHDEFAGRAVNAFYSVEDGHGFEDCHGHGTHVAGIIAGKTYGVAKDATIHNVRVIGCDGTALMSQVISGIEWVTQHHVKPAIANLSLGGVQSESLDMAVRNSIASGVVYTIASGNDAEDACAKSPARVSVALTVGAVDGYDRMTPFSNYGACLDLLAPGTDILSAWNSNDQATMMMMGTSMASPFVAGVAALYLQNNPESTPSEVSRAILEGATEDRLSLLEEGTPNLLIYSSILFDPFLLPTPVAEQTAIFIPPPDLTPTPTPEVDLQTFEDVPPDHWAYPYIEAAYREGYVAGCSSDPMRFCPNDPLSRAEISVFVDRGIHGPDFVPIWENAQIFGDVLLGDWFYEWVNVLWEDGNTSGCQLDGLAYCPMQYHTRAEASVFFLRLMHGSDFIPPEPEGLFVDAPLGDWYTPWVEAAYQDGLLPPCETEPETAICPLELMDRGRAAFMLVQALQLPLP